MVLLNFALTNVSVGIWRDSNEIFWSFFFLNGVCRVCFGFTFRQGISREEISTMILTTHDNTVCKIVLSCVVKIIVDISHMIIQFAKSFISYLSKAFHFSYNFFRICISSFVSLKNLHEAFFTPNFYFLSDNCINNFQPPSISVFRVLKATFFVLHFSSLTKFHAEYSTFDLLSFLLFPSIHWIQAFLFYNLREIHFVGNLKSRLNAVLYCVLCFSFKIFGI